MPTLGWTMIIKDEVFEFRRLLNSIQGTLFNQIVVIRTTTNEEIIKICEEFKVEHYYFEWVKDFSKARNFGIDKMKTDYCMWGDGDDLIKPQDYNKLQLLKPTLNLEMYFIDYVYNHDANDNDESILPRERIFKNIPKIRFENRVHETLPQCNQFTWTKVPDIKIHHYRMHNNDSERNIELLKLSYDENPNDPRTMYYYGRDLMGSNKQEGIELLEKFIKSGQGTMSDRANTCINLAMNYFNTDKKACERICYTGLAIESQYAELHYYLGMVKKETNQEEAIKYFEKCLKCKFGSTMLTQIKDYYSFLPYNELAILYFNKGDFLKALEYNIKSDEIKTNIGLKNDRPKIFDALYKKYPQPPKNHTFEIIDIILPLFNEKNLSLIEQLNIPARIIITDCGSDNLDYNLKGITVLGKPEQLRTKNEAYKEAILNSFSRFICLVDYNNTLPLLNLDKALEIMNSGRVAMVVSSISRNYRVIARSVLYEIGLDNLPDYYDGYLSTIFKSLNYMVCETHEAI